VVAIPSFRTRGDYLAIISLAFMFIVKSLIENLEIIGGPGA
jgi:branched-chain amino acid transport system permease protein